MRELLMELYITHGDRPFIFDHFAASKNSDYQWGYIKNIRPIKNIPNKSGGVALASYLTPKALEYIKNG